MRSLFLGAFSAIALAGCATTTAQQSSSVPQTSAVSVDDKGFAVRKTGGVYHVATGLVCPESYGDFPLSRTTEFRKDVDVSCSYEDPSSRVTIYTYLSGASLQDELEGTVVAVFEASDNDSLTLSRELSDECEAFGASFNMQSQLMLGLSDLMKNGGNEINIDPSREGGPVPYLATAIQGDGLNTYAAISQADKWRIKVRYTALGEFNADDETAQCKFLHDTVKTTVLSHGQGDGDIIEGDMQSLMLGGLSDALEDN